MPDTHNCKNFFDQGGDELVIGGKLTFLEGGSIGGIQYVIPLMPYVPDSTAETVEELVEDFNTLLASIRASGLMLPAPPTPPESGGGDGDDDNGSNGSGSGSGGGGESA